MFIHDVLIKQLVWLVVTRSEQNCKCTLLTSYQWGIMWIYFKSNGSYVLVTGMHEHARLGGWNQLQELESTTKQIEIGGNTMVKHLGAGPLWDTGTQ